MGRRKKYSDDDVIKAISDFPDSMFAAAKGSGIAYSTFVRRAKELGVYNPNQGGKGISDELGVFRYNKIPLDEILNGLHPTYGTGHLKERLFRLGIKKKVCERCGVGDTWMGEPLVLHLEHINGKSDDHRFNNLRILCPNCHSQTETYTGRNVARKGVSRVSDRELTEALVASPSIASALRETGLSTGIAHYRRAKSLIEALNSKGMLCKFQRQMSGLSTSKKSGKTSSNRKYGTYADRGKAKSQQWYDKQLEKVPVLLNSEIDFGSFGWVSRAAQVLEIYPQKVHIWMKRMLPDFYAKNCFKRGVSV
jgi:hypothetical protein